MLVVKTSTSFSTKNETTHKTLIKYNRPKLHFISSIVKLYLPNCLLNLLNSKYENIRFEDDFYSEAIINNIKPKIFILV